MFASLNHTFNQPAPEPGSEGEGRTQPHEVVGRLAYLIDQLSQDQQLKLLRALFKDKLGNVLLKLFVDIPASLAPSRRYRSISCHTKQKSGLGSVNDLLESL